MIFQEKKKKLPKLNPYGFFEFGTKIRTIDIKAGFGTPEARGKFSDLISLRDSYFDLEKYEWWKIRRKKYE